MQRRSDLGRREYLVRHRVELSHCPGAFSDFGRHLDGIARSDDQLGGLAKLAQGNPSGMNAHRDLRPTSPFLAEPVIDLTERALDLGGGRESGPTGAVEIAGEAEQGKNAVMLDIANDAACPADGMAGALRIPLERKEDVMGKVLARERLAIGEVAEQQHSVPFILNGSGLRAIDWTLRKHQRRDRNVAGG